VTYLKQDRPVVAITMGDPAGSGPEIDIKALRTIGQADAKFVLIGDFRIFKKASELVNANDLKFVKIAHPAEARDEPKTVYVVDVGTVDFSNLVYGKPSISGGKAAYECIVQAVNFAKTSAVQAIVTAPISKDALNMAGYNYPGHTELLAELTNSEFVMMTLVLKHVKVPHVTAHISLKEALDLIKKERVLRTIEVTHRSLVDLFGISEPKIAVTGLNPHAGEGGLFGNEEIQEIIPAIEEARKKGINVSGPFPPDSVFYRAYWNKEFDSVVAMYHDQGHIAMKMVGFMYGVNLTLGLPIIRASPDHGTVWGKAGKGTADERSTVEAMRLVAELARRKLNQKPSSSDNETSKLPSLSSKEK
jgi:4-hydroxythreonine-4-phosphate dehydrogenase